jgi:hypothetical protein
VNEVEEVVSGGALDRPRFGQAFVRGQDLLDDDVPVAGLFAQRLQVGEGIA